MTRRMSISCQIAHYKGLWVNAADFLPGQYLVAIVHDAATARKQWRGKRCLLLRAPVGRRYRRSLLLKWMQFILPFDPLSYFSGPLAILQFKILQITVHRQVSIGLNSVSCCSAVLYAALFIFICLYSYRLLRFMNERR